MARLENKSWTDIEQTITSYIPNSFSEIYNFNRKNSLEWKIKSASFTYNFIGEQAGIYYKMLRGGYDLTKSKLKKSVTERQDKKTNRLISTTEYSGITKVNSEQYYESVHLQIEFNEIKEEKKDSNEPKKSNSDEPKSITCGKATYLVPETLGYLPYRLNKDRLQIKIYTRKNKISSLCRKYGIDRDVKKFFDIKDIIDSDLFEHYITHIAGSGDFYKYKDAEKIIMKSDYSKKEKEKMCDVLKSVASYKGVSNYLNHVEDEKIAFASMASVRKRAYALKVLNNLQKCGINPLTISVRDKISYDKLDNLMTVYRTKVIKGKNQMQAKSETPELTLSSDENLLSSVDLSPDEELPDDTAFLTDDSESF